MGHHLLGTMKILLGSAKSWQRNLLGNRFFWEVRSLGNRFFWGSKGETLLSDQSKGRGFLQKNQRPRFSREVVEMPYIEIETKFLQEERRRREKQIKVGDKCLGEILQSRVQCHGLGTYQLKIQKKNFIEFSSQEVRGFGLGWRSLYFVLLVFILIIVLMKRTH